MVSAAVTVPLSTVLDFRDRGIAATRTGDAIRPSEYFEVPTASLVTIELIEKGEKVHESVPQEEGPVA